MLINYICYKETWILFRDYRSGVSKIIRDAYHYYGVMEFGKKQMKRPINHVDRHIKLISIAGRKVNTFFFSSEITYINEFNGYIIYTSLN